MTPRKQPTDIVDAYTQWMLSSIDAWATSATAMMDKTTSRSFKAADWYAETSVYAGRMAQATLDLFNGLVDRDAQSTVASDDFSTPSPKSLTEVRDLRLAGPLHATMTQTTVAAAAVKIEPSTLTGGATTFHLEVDTANLPGDAYWGTVEVLVAGAVTDTVDVVVQVP